MGAGRVLATGWARRVGEERTRASSRSRSWPDTSTVVSSGSERLLRVFVGASAPRRVGDGWLEEVEASSSDRAKSVPCFSMSTADSSSVIFDKVWRLVSGAPRGGVVLRWSGVVAKMGEVAEQQTKRWADRSLFDWMQVAASCTSDGGVRSSFHCRCRAVMASCGRRPGCLGPPQRGATGRGRG